MTQRAEDVDDAPEKASYFSLVVAATAGLSAVVLVGGLVAIEQLRVTHEVLLWAPDHVQTGDAIPVRALVFTDLEGDAGGRLVQPELQLRLLSGSTELAAGLTQPSAFESVSTTLRCDACEGDITLVAEVHQADALLARTERTIHFGTTVPSLPEGMRLSDALQLLQIESDARVDAAMPGLDVRAVGGVCVAEASCEVLLQGVPSEIRLSECGNVELRGQHVEGSVRRLELVIHGPEAHCVVETDIPTPPSEVPLSNDGTMAPPVTTMRFGLQLPVALATARLDAHAEGLTLVATAEPPIGRSDVIVDIYREERWIDTRALHTGEALRLTLPEPGVFRLQARADVTSSERAYLRLVDTSPLSTEERAAQRWIFAARETELIAVPSSTSGLATDEAVLGQRRQWMRIVAGLGVLAAFLLMLASVLRRGIASEAEARQLMLASGIEGADDDAARRRSRWTVIAYVAAIALAVLLGAGFLVARPFFMG
jgi:hypothetical protein